MHMHAIAIVVHYRLWHEGRGFAETVRNVVDYVFQNLHFVRLGYQRVEFGPYFTLPRRRNLVVVYLCFLAHFLECQAHG